MRRTSRFGLVTMAAILGLLPALAAATSLYDAQQFTPLTSDLKSFKVGDELTVLIVESSNAESQAESKGNRNTTLTGTLQTPAGNRAGGIGLTHQTDNSGDTNRMGSLQAEISVRITKTLANGDFEVDGHQAITINGEEQKISVSGLVRPVDVSSDNVVLSTRLANADIHYSGKGFVDRNQHEGWLSRLLDYIGL